MRKRNLISAFLFFFILIPASVRAASAGSLEKRIDDLEIRMITMNEKLDRVLSGIEDLKRQCVKS